MRETPDVIAAYIAAYNARDIGGMLDLLTDNVRFQNLSDGKVTAEASGKESFRRLAEAGAQAFSERRQTVRNAITVADITLLEIDFRARVKADLPNGWAAGQKIEMQGASLFRLKDGLIAEIIDQS